MCDPYEFPWRRRFLAAVLWLAGVSSSPAQQPTSPPASAGSETVEVRLVQLTLHARDRRGRPVTDLSADEIIVKERGRKMRIAFLEPFASNEPPPAGVKLYLAAPGNSTEATATSEAGDARYVIVFIDADNDYRLLRHEASAQLLGFIRDELDDSTRMAVFSYDGQIHLEQSFTSDSEALVGAVARGFGRPSRPRLDLRARMRGLQRNLESCERSGRSGTRQGDESCLRGVAYDYADERRPRAKEFLAGLEELIGFAGGLQARTTVIALTHGVAVDPARELREAMRAVYGNTEQLAALQLAIDPGEGASHRRDALTQQALEQRVALHFIDRQPAPSGDFDASVGQPYQPGASPLRTAYEAAQGDLGIMAERTGGMLIASPDVLGSVRRLMELERGGYSLGFYADNRVSLLKPLKVRVTAKRKGVRLHQGRAYLNRPGDAPVLPASLSLGAPVSLEEDQRAGEFVPFTLVLDPTPLVYTVGADEAAADFTIHVRVETSTGRAGAETFHFFRHAYDRETWEAGEAEPVPIAGWTELPPGGYRIVAYIRNPRTGRTAELIRELDVPK